MHQKHDEQENQARQRGPSHALPPDPPVSKTGIQFVGFDSAEHQTLRELFDMMHKDVWKVLFKGAEVPPPLTEDRGLSAKRPANPVSLLYLIRCLFSPVSPCAGSKPPRHLTGLGRDSGAD